MRTFIANNFLIVVKSPATQNVYFRARVLLKKENYISKPRFLNYTNSCPTCTSDPVAIMYVLIYSFQHWNRWVSVLLQNSSAFW